MTYDAPLEEQMAELPPPQSPADALQALFADPPAAFRPMPQWSWNGDLTRERITKQLAQFAAQGCGGLFTHARPGHITGYLSARFMELWRFALDEAARLGMGFHIYDEFMCPAGHAGGLVIGEGPHLAVQELTLSARAGLTRYPPPSLGVWRAEGEGEGRRLVQLTDAEARALGPDAPAWALVIAPQGPQPRYGGHPFPDLLRRETTDAFISSTHERYAEVAGETFASAYDDAAGAPDSGVRFMFCDEPMLVGSGGLPLSPDVLRHFEADHGYDLREHLPELAWGAPPDARAVRYDYWCTINRLLNEAFMRPMAEWCTAHDLLFTGHLMEHEWPSPRSHASAMASLRWMQAPGTDLLGFQYATTTPEENGIYLLNLYELRSVKRQLGREWMLVETCGGGGYGRAFDLFKPLEDLVMAFGFNVIDPHLSAQTVAGIRKYDWPQTLSDHSPWWAHYRHQADHVARVNAALCQGRDPGARVLVLHPTTTGWLHYTAPVFGKLAGPLADADAAAMSALRESQVELALTLMAVQVDFDLGDELILAELASASDGKLVIETATPLPNPRPVPTTGRREGADAPPRALHSASSEPCRLGGESRRGRSAATTRYDTVVVSAAMETWTDTTLALMTAYLESGGRVIALRRPDGTSAPPLLSGRPSDAPRRLSERFPDQWTAVDSAEAAAWSLREAHTPPLTAPDGGPLPAGLVWRYAALGDGTSLWFFCNPWAEPIRTKVRLPGRKLRVMDTTTGLVGPAHQPDAPAELPSSSAAAQPSLVAPLDLPPRGHTLWWVSADASTLAAQAGEAFSLTPEGRKVVGPERGKSTTEPIELSLMGIERLDPNLLMVDYCDVVAGQRGGGPPREPGRGRIRHHLTADEAMWRSVGFDGNPWQASHQLKRTIIDRPVDPDSAARIAYRFVLDPVLPAAARATLCVGVERPWLYDVALNGHPLNVEGASRWFDEDARALAIGAAVRTGENVLTLAARPFHTLCEVMPVYVVGDFSAVPAEPGFVVADTKSMVLGDWTAQGMPFYAGTVRYRFGFALDVRAPSLELRIPAWAGSVVAVSLDRGDAGIVAHPPHALTLRDVSTGPHTLDLDVVGNMRNMMGPHHSEGLPGRWTWANAPAEQPPGSAYGTWPSGLLRMPELRAA